MKLNKFILYSILLANNVSMTADRKKEKEEEAAKDYEKCSVDCYKDGPRLLSIDFIRNWDLVAYQACLQKCLMIYKRQLRNIDQGK